MYMTPGRGSTPNHKAITEGPIAEFIAVIEETPADMWQKRCASLRKLMDAIPEGPTYSEGIAWFNSPPVLRHLAVPIGQLLKDPRSTVVKRTCESLTRLFIKCQTDARYLFRDIMPTILSVHAQTVQVIRTAVQNMVMESIPEVPCKMVMPMWMERLKVDKSRTVRDACALYLGQALQCWTEEGYLTEEIWMQVGTSLIRTLRDPSPNVRAQAKAELERMRGDHPDYWENLVNNPDGAASKDAKLQRWLKSLGQGASPDAEELSVASRFSYNSDTRYSRSAVRSSPANNRFFAPADDAVPISIDVSPSVPTSTNANTNHQQRAQDNTKNKPKPRAAGGGLGPPLRPTTAPFQQAMESPRQPRSVEPGTPPRPPTAGAATPPSSSAKSAVGSFLHTIEDNTESHSSDKEHEGFPTDLKSTFNNKPTTPTAAQEKMQPRAFDFAKEKQPPKPDAEPPKQRPIIVVDDKEEKKGDYEENPFIANMHQLKKHASKRRSRNSILMQERFRMSSSFAESEKIMEEEKPVVLEGKRSEEENEVPNSDDNKVAAAAAPRTPASAPEHMVIAIRLLRAHKAHVDQIMETLKIEMDVLRDFDRLLEEPGRPTDEEVLDYFESVGLCLEQRIQAGAGLQREMDCISRGEQE